jgi:Domain of unknown function (DUF4166)/Saccharopine dehydrogenase NADP binding domain
MSGARLRILIVGGYGVFGGRLAQLLADEDRLTLVIAGRSKDKARSFCAGLQSLAQLTVAHFDRDGDLEAQLKIIAPDIVVDASGPFQDYGADPYRLVKAALALGINYMDFADGSEFVEGVSRFDPAAEERGVFLLSGVSSFPVLTAAVVRRLARGLQRIDTITGGIAPSPYAGVGQNVIRAIAGYAGKELALIRNGDASTGYGLAETLRYTIGPPGRVPLRNRRFSLVDVPDLKVLPEQWPGLRSIWMGAGPVPESLHTALNMLAWCVRLKLLPSLSFLAPVFFRAINTFKWGEHRGGMFVSIEGAKADGTTVTRSWHLLAEGDDGPFIPSMAIEAIVRRCLEGRRPAAGARSAANELDLSDYETLFRRRTIFTGVREAGTFQENAPLYKRILGTAWEQLPRQIREMHQVMTTLTAEGRADVERGRNAASRAIGWLFGFPQQGRDVPLRVHFVSDGHRERWVRKFGNRSFWSDQAEGRGRSDKLLEESFGVFSFGLALVASPDRLKLVVRRWRLFRLPLPLAFAPFGDVYEFVEAGRFNFHVEICLPVIGLVIRYRGYLVPAEAGR